MGPTDSLLATGAASNHCCASCDSWFITVWFLTLCLDWNLCWTDNHTLRSSLRVLHTWWHHYAIIGHYFFLWGLLKLLDWVGLNRHLLWRLLHRGHLHSLCHGGLLVLTSHWLCHWRVLVLLRHGLLLLDRLCHGWLLILHGRLLHHGLADLCIRRHHLREGLLHNGLTILLISWWRHLFFHFNV